MNIRENNYDLLRILGMIGVILIHVSAGFINNEATLYSQGVYLGKNTFLICIFNCIGRFGVPCFLMLTGAFLLSNEKNKDFKYFYKKMFGRIFLPTIVFTIFYFIYRMLFAIIGDKKAIISILKDLLKGQVFYHMWYMYMLIGIYLLIPIVIRLKDEIGEKSFKIVSIVFVFIAALCIWTTDFIFEWNMAKSFLYLSYVMIGYVIYNSNKAKDVKKVLLYLVLGLFIELLMAFLINRVIVLGIKIGDLEFAINGISSPLSMLTGILFFISFTNLDLKHDYSKLSELSFYIYLFHAGIWNLTQKVIDKLCGNNFILNFDARVSIPCLTCFVLLFSVLCSMAYMRIINTDMIIQSKEKIMNNVFRNKEIS